MGIESSDPLAHGGVIPNRSATTTVGMSGKSTAVGAVSGSAFVRANGRVGWSTTLAFLTARTIPGLERIDGDMYVRGMPDTTLRLGSDPEDKNLLVEVVEPRMAADAARSPARSPSLSSSLPPSLLAAAATVSDIETDLDAVATHLRLDHDLAERLDHTSLPRVPGTFDRFELLMRAIIGQQVSVAAARTTLGSLLDLVDGIPSTERRGLRSGFPTAQEVLGAPLDELGVPGRKRACVRSVAEAVASGEIDLGDDANPDAIAERLLAINGIGPWTVGYVLMRAFNQPDQWPINDLVLRQTLGIDNRELARRAEAWSPWRAYASILLWATS